MTNVVHCGVNCHFMKKKVKKTIPIKDSTEAKINKVEEPQAPYFSKSIKAIPSLKDFTFDEFKNFKRYTV